MTSHQPGAVQPGTTSDEGTPGGGPHPALAQQWLVRLLPLMLLIILGLAGLRGAVATPGGTVRCTVTVWSSASRSRSCSAPCS